MEARPAPARQPAPEPASAPPTPAPGVSAGTPEARMDPLVQDIIELFHARVLHVEKKPQDPT